MEPQTIEHLCSYEISFVQQKCPAFKEGCPYKSIVNGEFMKAAKKCPEFHDHCPFKNVTNLAEIYEKLSQIPDVQCHSKIFSEMFIAMHVVSESLEQNLGNCPVFMSGCLFKSVENTGGKLVCSAESASVRQAGRNNLMKFDVSEIKQKCPAFEEVCPYAKVRDEDFKNSAAFSNGCPFKNAKNLADVYDTLSEIPVHDSLWYNTLEAFTKIHSVSVKEESIAGHCPVFHDENGKPSCPFKSVRNEGKHLVRPFNNVVQE